MMGCYRETLAFLRAIDSADGVYFEGLRHGGAEEARHDGGYLQCRPTPRRSTSPLASPGHARGLRQQPGLALRAGLMLRGEVQRPDDNETCDSWLRRLGQTQTLRNAFWDPLIWGTLNDDPLVSSAALFTRRPRPRLPP